MNDSRHSGPGGHLRQMPPTASIQALALATNRDLPDPCGATTNNCQEQIGASKSEESLALIREKFKRK